MKYIMIILVSLMLGASGHASSNDKTLWGKAEYGMTPAQVLKAFPFAQKNPRPQTVALSNSQSYIIIPSKRIHDIEFNVAFFFNDHGLAQVTLEAQRTYRRGAKQMASLLMEKYGKPVSETDNTVVWKIEWYHAPLSIEMAHYGDPDAPSLYIFYGHSRYDAMNSL
jgi:hypothetical protein